MPKMLELTGQRFGKLTVVGLYSCGKRSRWNCRCDCGNEKVVPGSVLKRGASKSCGCVPRPGNPNAKGKPTHGKSQSAEYQVWEAMCRRCSAPTADSFKHYGGRGIVVCDRWLQFENFLLDMGERPSPKHTIERRDNDGGYEPGNCEWATRTQQARNRRNSLIVNYRGVVASLAEVCERFGGAYNAVYYKYRRGSSIDEAMAHGQNCARQKLLLEGVKA